jgi:hypothetical protein
MLHRNFATTGIAARLRVAALVVALSAALFGVFAVVAQPARHGDRILTAANGPSIERGHASPLDERWFW